MHGVTIWWSRRRSSLLALLYKFSPWQRYAAHRREQARGKNTQPKCAVRARGRCKLARCGGSSRCDTFAAALSSRFCSFVSRLRESSHARCTARGCGGGCHRVARKTAAGSRCLHPRLPLPLLGTGIRPRSRRRCGRQDTGPGGLLQSSQPHSCTARNPGARCSTQPAASAGPDAADAEAGAAGGAGSREAEAGAAEAFGSSAAAGAAARRARTVAS